MEHIDGILVNQEIWRDQEKKDRDQEKNNKDKDTKVATTSDDGDEDMVICEPEREPNDAASPVMDEDTSDTDDDDDDDECIITKLQVNFQS